MRKNGDAYEKLKSDSRNEYDIKGLSIFVVMIIVGLAFGVVIVSAISYLIDIL